MADLFGLDPTVIHGRSRHFLGLVTAHEVRRIRARDKMLSAAFARPFRAGYSHMLAMLQDAQATTVARDIYLAAIDRQLSLIHAEEERIEKLAQMLKEAPDKESRIAVAKKIDEAFAQLEGKAQALKEVSEA